MSVNVLNMLKNVWEVRHDLKWSESIAEQMDGVINCPRCLHNYLNEEQPLCRFGDYPDELFCPHCNLEVKLSLHYNGSDGTSL